MEALLGRYRNLTVLMIVVVSQLLYLAYQIKTNGDERLIRVWAVTAVTPMAGIVEAIRGNTIGFLQDGERLLPQSTRHGRECPGADNVPGADSFEDRSCACYWQ